MQDALFETTIRPGELTLNFLNFDFKKLIIALLLFSIPFFLINMEAKPKNDDSFSPLVEIGSGVQNAYSQISQGVQGTVQLYFNLVNTRIENRMLSQKNLKLKAELSSLAELKLENERLNQLLAFKQKTKMSLLPSKVIGTDLVPDHYTLTINRGSDHSVEKNMAVISTGGVIGYITEVFESSSRVLLLVDRYAVIDAIVQRTRTRGLVEGLGSNSCRFSYIASTDEDIVEGDLLVTSGLNNIFPKGFPIGIISKVEKNRVELKQYFEMKPVTNLYNLEEIFVILKTNNEDLLPLPSSEPDSTEEAV